MIKIITDSACDISKEEAARLGITVIPMTVRFGEDEYRDFYDITHEQFFEKLIETSELPTTSQIPPYSFEQAFKNALADQNADDFIICITISSKLSGTYQNACMAAVPYSGRVIVIDSLNASVGELILVRYAHELIQAAADLTNQEVKTGSDYTNQEAKTAADIGAKLIEASKHICLLALLDTLSYLKKGGRVSAGVAFAGELLSIKPVIAIIDGKVEFIGKARGSKQGNNLLRSMVLDKGIDFSKPYCTAYSGLDDRFLRKYIDDSASLWQDATTDVPMSSIGSTIGTHIGPGAIAVSFFEKF